MLIDMEQPFEFSLPPSNFKNWLERIEELTGAQRSGGSIVINHKAVQGIMEGDTIQPGLDYIKVEVIPTSDLIYFRESDASKQHFSIVISIEKSPFTVLTEEGKIEFDLDSQAKIILLSPLAKIKIEVKAKTPYTFIVVFLDKAWVSQNLIDPSNEKDIEYLKDLNRPAILYKNMGSGYKEIIQKILAGKNQSKIVRLSAFISLISELFTEFRKKESSLQLKVKQEDSEAIIKVCNLIDEEMSNMPSIASLSKVAGMSLSKFKYTFKYITGMTPYQYHLKYKLERAKDMLINSNMTVSEVGYICGYSNLSHFSRVFKKIHGFLPGTLRK